MKSFRRSFQVKAPIVRVAEFHSSTKALRLLTPPPVLVQFHEVEPLGVGSRSDFTLWLGPLPIRWVARHTEYDPVRGFKEHQERGPFAQWEHTHTFVSLDDNLTEVVDEIKAEFSDNLLWGMVTRLMWLGLPSMFAYRAVRTRWAVEKG